MATQKQTPLSERQLERIARALAEPRRVAILRQIGSANGPAACAAIREMQDVSPATLSHHLKELETAELIAISRDGKCMNVELRRDVLHSYLATLGDL